MLEYPEIGAARPELGEAIRGYPVGEHRIFYSAVADRVVVERVLQKAMDVELWF